MARKAALLVALVLALTCGPTAIPRAATDTSSASPHSIASSDLITLREGGQDPGLAVRKVSSAELVRSLPDGMLLPDGTTFLTIAPAVYSTLFKKIDRRTGATLSSQSVAGSWQRGPFASGTSPDGSRLVLFGSSYNFTDSSGVWTARSRANKAWSGLWSRRVMGGRCMRPIPPPAS